MVPTGYYLGLHTEFGASGLMAGVLAGTVIAAVLLGARFARISAGIPAPR